MAKFFYFSLPRKCVTMYMYKQYITLQRRWCHNVKITALLWLCQSVGSTHDTLYLLYSQHCCNLEIMTSNPWRLHKVDTTRSNLLHCSNVASVMDSRFTFQYITDVVMATSIQLWNVNITTLRPCCVIFARNVKCELSLVAR